MATREDMLKDLAKYFTSKGRTLELSEYCAHVDHPFSNQEIKFAFKSYSKMLDELAAMPKAAPKAKPKVEPKAKPKAKPKAE